MTPEKTQALREKYPELYEHISGFECDDGWFDLLDRLSAKLPKECRAGYVKEKFGGLRFHTTKVDDNVSSLIRDTEEESFHICEVCGAPGTIGGKRWIRTLCETHLKEHQKRKQEKR